MSRDRTNGGDGRGQRRWAFAGCVFDEASWTLTVDGRRVAIETKPLELLRELLLQAGNLVSKDQLMDTIWPDVEVVEASLPTAIAKLRRALQDDRPDRPIIETVPRLGYRLAVPVEVDHHPNAQDAADVSSAAKAAKSFDAIEQRAPGRQAWALAAGFGILSLSIALAIGTARDTDTPATQSTSRNYTKADIYSALRKTDIEAIERLLAAGWDPNALLDTDRSAGLGVLLNNCEWDREIDKRRMLIAVRTLVDAGARVTYRNVWGDTPYSIAKAERYCGPDHPATRFLHMVCYEPGSPHRDRCEANYVRDASGKVIRQEPPQPAK